MVVLLDWAWPSRLLQVVRYLVCSSWTRRGVTYSTTLFLVQRLAAAVRRSATGARSGVPVTDGDVEGSCVCVSRLVESILCLPYLGRSFLLALLPAFLLVGGHVSRASNLAITRILLVGLLHSLVRRGQRMCGRFRADYRLRAYLK